LNYVYEKLIHLNKIIEIQGLRSVGNDYTFMKTNKIKIGKIKIVKYV